MITAADKRRLRVKTGPLSAGSKRIREYPPPKKDAATSRHRTGFLPPTAAAISSKTQSMTVLRNTRIST